MTQMMTVPVLPESAPFSPAQRAWLNGFFAGLMGSQRVEAPKAAAPAKPAVEEETFPWHDPALLMDERLKLAEGKPLDRVMMAAMAQLDCGACGYLCKTYGEAIAHGREKDLTKCAPGGKATARKLKELFAGRSSMAAPTVEVSVKGASLSAKSGYDRANPFPAPLLECKALNSPRSAKDTRFISLDLSGSNLMYSAGDALGLYPENCPDMVGWIIDALDATGSESVKTPAGERVSVQEALHSHYNISKPSDGAIELLMTAAGDASEREQLKQMLEGDGAPAGVELIDLLRQFKSARPSAQQLVGTLLPLEPRLYSISSSPRTTPNEVHLTVGVVRYLNNAGRQCKGVASTFLAERLKQGQKARVFIHKSQHFGLPKDPRTPIIMVGPGTGISPFRSFLYERRAIAAPCKNWLFFGDQHMEHDFLYKEEMERFLSDGLLTRLDVAFSRDQAEKLYVQHRMLEQGAELWKWLNDGAHFYVCGDAKRMARDVDTALRTVIEQHGRMSADAAKAYLADLSKNGRYQRDVY